jgi:hypothetical protein
MKDDSLTPLGLSRDELEPVMISCMRGLLIASYCDPLNDVIRTWHTLNGIAQESPWLKMIKSKVFDELNCLSRSGQRWDRAKEYAKKDRLMLAREFWILEHWVSLIRIDGDIFNPNLCEIGIAYLTDETASAAIEYIFPECGDFSTKQFRDFRERYELVQVPLAHRHRGVMVNGELKITHVGRKSV